MARFAEKMVQLGTERSEIREAFAFAQARAAEVGPDKVDDFSIGNPSVPAPKQVGDLVKELVDAADPVQLHGYTPAQGDGQVRKALADDLNRRYGTDYDGDCFYLTAGAAAGLRIVLSALGCPGDAFVTMAPYFPEYKVFVESAGCTLVPVPADLEDFQIDFAAFQAALTPQTKAVIINSPNNPTGVVYSQATIEKLAQTLEEKSQEYGHTIYLISDEPYREIVYGEEPLPWVPSYYANTLVCYSYSKSLSLPGQRIGYVLVPKCAEGFGELYAAVCGAGRALGYVCAPSLFQFVVARCTGQTADIGIYRENRDILLNALREMGYTCAQPDGAFYLFPRTLEPDAHAFCQRARKYDLVLVPGDSFGCPGHVRISYCVPTEQIRRSLVKFQKLAEEYGLGK
ncbi:MAG: pyridoxal phosphate-dependent aminotransferase [Evtepia sp.]|uniref:pyridoxal phosphate-dependent aminotransferase n=1 Tax=Evtepia sp. TaxID=2773933 RepID=UPI002A75A2E7|nr:pyridoxal phosphate-dependent aminotransferase [Evtepia sp.]MDY3014433.1 pyridoxal phosphate-dependent aminotransferase [Evtepia sp.]